ncbi:transposase [Kitasatospora sp. NPDC089509]|uniref:transposase n=1 Tax=Kitasatospora sp. NPDC089509 TaxID=3364079 RepID=UPI0038209F93
MIDDSHRQARHSGPQQDRARSTARPGSKHHVITDGRGTPPVIPPTGGNRHYDTQLLPLLDTVRRVPGRTDQPRHRPRQPFADQGYASTSTAAC